MGRLIMVLLLCLPALGLSQPSRHFFQDSGLRLLRVSGRDTVPLLIFASYTSVPDQLRPEELRRQFESQWSSPQSQRLVPVGRGTGYDSRTPHGVLNIDVSQREIVARLWETCPARAGRGEPETRLATRSSVRIDFLFWMQMDPVNNAMRNALTEPCGISTATAPAGAYEVASSNQRGSPGDSVRLTGIVRADPPGVLEDGAEVDSIVVEPREITVRVGQVMNLRALIQVRAYHGGAEVKFDRYTQANDPTILVPAGPFYRGIRPGRSEIIVGQMIKGARPRMARVKAVLSVKVEP